MEAGENRSDLLIIPGAGFGSTNVVPRVMGNRGQRAQQHLIFLMVAIVFFFLLLLCRVVFFCPLVCY